MKNQTISRRNFVGLGSGFALYTKLVSIGFLLPNITQARLWKEEWFSTGNLSETLMVMEVKDLTESKKVFISAPDTAENGAYVGVGVDAEIDNVEMLAILVEKNPIILSGFFEFNVKVLPSIATKIKMAESSDIIALVKASDNKYFMAKKSVSVTLGGCGN